ncbi:TrbC/VirB2 family protein [Lichenicoccus roseus]|uniref:Conjugal transfer protein TrbC n=1 Tax=Lichenicoccus roseus TaxID=2683649 RepID=A0A5R9J0K8_9PROT|nr:TrbC/VirB2 family protein [Lichenicoccus roseus]TLU71174.1 hypothetical protein FE263_18565 [Lichenicoccus roseus]
MTVNTMSQPRPSYRTTFLPLAVSAATTLAPLTARAATAAGGGGMPYSAGLNTFATSVQGEVAFIIILIAIVAGVGAFIFMGGLEVLLTTIGKTIIGIGIVGAVVAFATLAGVTGAIV